MKKLIILAATATIAFTGVAFADATTQNPGIHGRSIEYGESPNGFNLNTTQPSGGKVADMIAAPTGNLSGSTMGAANMNGPLRNGQPFDEGFWLRNSSPYED